jgi:hypothetical protein
VEAF